MDIVENYKYKPHSSEIQCSQLRNIKHTVEKYKAHNWNIKYTELTNKNKNQSINQSIKRQLALLSENT